MKNVVKINGVVIKTPHRIKYSKFNVTKSTRLANGSLNSDLVAQKVKFEFTYDAIESRDWKKILDMIYYSKKIFHELEIIEFKETKKYTVYFGELASELHNFNDGNAIFKNVGLNAIEK